MSEKSSAVYDSIKGNEMEKTKRNHASLRVGHPTTATDFHANETATPHPVVLLAPWTDQ